MDHIPCGCKESEATERLSLSPSQANKPAACMNFPTEQWSASRVCWFPHGWQPLQRDDLLNVCRRWTQNALIRKRLTVQKQKGCWNARWEEFVLVPGIQRTLRVPSHSGRETTSDFRHINQKKKKKRCHSSSPMFWILGIIPESKIVLQECEVSSPQLWSGWLKWFLHKHHHYRAPWERCALWTTLVGQPNKQGALE